MAIIYTYPEINQVEGEDLLLISDTSLYKRPTRSVTMDNLAAYVGTVIGIGFWNLGTAPDSIFTTKMASIGQDANIASSKLNVYKTDDMTASVPHVATFNESLSNHSLNLWPSPGNNSADIYGSVSRGAFTGSGTVDQIKGIESIGRHSGSGSVNIIQGTHAAASLTGAGSVKTIAASYAKTFIEGTGSNNIENAFGAWNVVELDGLNDVDTIYGTYSNVVLTNGEVNDDAIGHFIGFDQVSADTEINNAYYIHAINNSLSVTGEKFFIKDETGIPSQFSNKLVLNAYGSGTFTGTATQRLAVDTNGNVIEIPIGSGPVDGSGTANYSARWIDTDTLGIGALYDNGNYVGIGTNNPTNKLHVYNGITRLDSGSASSNALGVYSNFSNTAINLFAGSTGSGFISVNSSGMNLGAPWNGGTKVSILNNGNVGIGATSPGSTLPTDSETATKVLQLTGVSGSTGDTAVLLRSSDNSSGLDLWHNASTGDSYIDNRYNSNQGDTIFRVKTAGTPLEALRITGDGNVGIGTTSPGAKLDVNGTTFLRSVALDTIFGQSGNNIAFINTGNTTFNNSNVGIGTTNPNTKLHIKENGYGFKLEGLTDGRYIRMTGSGSDAYIDSQGQNFLVLNNSGNGVKVLSGSSNTRLIIGSDSVSLQSQNDTLKFLTSSSEAMRITSDGKLGIGTTNPLAKLQVSSTSGWGVFTERGIKDGSTSTYSHSYGAGNAHVLGRATIFESTVTFSTLTADAQTKEYRLQNSSNKLVLASVVAGITTENNILVASGTNIGIGTNSPSEKLEVAGGGRFEGMTVKGTNSSYWLYDRDLTNRGQESFRITRNVGSVTFYDRTYSGGYEELDFLKFNHSTSGSSVLSLKSKTTIDFLINQSNVARINSAGNVGIGTTNPTAKLDVNGDIRIKGENQLYLGGATSVPNWEITASGSDLIVNDTGTNVGSVLFNNDEGVALPRLTTTEINAISSPTQGLMAYNTTLNTICFYNGSSWQKVSHTSM